MNNIISNEINQIIALYKNYLSSEYLKDNFNLENISKTIEEWRINHEYLHEFSSFSSSGFEMTLPSLMDLNKYFIALDKGEILYPKELINVSELLACSDYLYNLLADKKQFYHLNDDALDLNPLSNLQKEINSDIEPDYTISSHASIRLKEIRDKLSEISHQLSSIMIVYKNKYSRYLSDDLITIKGGEEVLPIKNGNQGYIKGSILSYSSTGETVYMVPYEVIDLRNKMKRLKEAEKDEEMKILADLASKCSKQLKYLKRDYEIYLTFDRYLAAYRFGSTYDGAIAEESSNQIVLKSLFHPLLKAAKVVTNTLILGYDQPKVLLISGPNAGGKSVLIKAVAIAVYMDRLGLLTPTKGEAQLPFIDRVFFLGGDNQSVLDNLSTFSSHVIGLKEITQNATANSLVIIAEVGEGTSPKDGEALGVGILKFFEHLKSYTILTSHYDGLKIYAASDQNVLTGAMEFDNDGLKPTYRLLLHTTGKSYGLVLAKSLGLSSQILEDAKAFQMNLSDRNVEALMEKLNEQMIAAFEMGAKLENDRWGKPNVIKVRYEKLLSIPAGHQDDDCRMIQAAKVVTEAVGITPAFMPGGSTNANMAISKGIPAVCFGRGGEEYGQHTLDEWFNPKGVEACEQKSILMLLALAGLDHRIKPLGETL